MGITGRKWGKIHHVRTVKPKQGWLSWIAESVAVLLFQALVIYLALYLV